MTGSTPCQARNAHDAAHASRGVLPRPCHKNELSSEEANGWDRKVINNNMQHTQVIENFVKNGQGGRGTYLKADEDVLYSKFPVNYRPYGWYDGRNSGQT